MHFGTRPDRNDLGDALGAIDAGEDVSSSPSRLGIETLTTCGRIFRPTDLELLKSIVEHEPTGIRGLARLVDRHPPAVTENAHEPADDRLIELEDEGRAKRPTVWYDTFELSGDIPLEEIDTGDDTPIGS